MRNSTEQKTNLEVIKTLVIDDDRGDYVVIESLLRSLAVGRYELTWVNNGNDGLRELVSNGYDVCLLDYRLGPDDGLDLLRSAIEQGCNRPVIVLTGFGNYQLDLEAMNTGAVDFLVKDSLEAPVLERSMRYAIEHWRATQRLEASIREKEVLLKEIHHRVKNNLQIVSSLLNLQAAYVAGDPSAAVLQVCCDRVRSIALVHEKLYRTPNLEAIDFTDYAQGLLTELSRSYGMVPERIQIVFEGNKLELSVTQAVPLGLILHELVSNSFKHAFPEGRSGEIRVRFEKLPNDFVRLSVADNGVGIKEKNEVPKQRKTLGMELVNTLSAQLDGKIETRNSNGAEFILTFKGKVHV